MIDIAPEADGSRRLRLEVTAPAESGKANRALIKLLAATFAIPPSRWSLALGAARRDKTLAIADVTGEEWAHIEAVLAALETEE